MKKIKDIFKLLIAISIILLTIYFFDIPYFIEPIGFLFSGILKILQLKWS